MKIKDLTTIIPCIFFLLGTVSCEKKINDTKNVQLNIASNVKYAGVRSSSYGIKPFPKPAEWTKAMQQMSSYYPNSTPSAVWIVGELSKETGCHLFFPADGKKYDNVIFDDVDKHESYLNHFDSTGIKVFLQVEPGNADIFTLMDLVLNRYKHHSCVAGFGIDVEWFRQSDRKGWGIPVDDSSAKAWEEKVKSFNSDYRLFLKHWDRDWMPKTYRGNIIFISDSQGLENLKAMVDEYSQYWADYFKPNPVYFQIGYRSDNNWFKDIPNPTKTVGDSIIAKVDQETGIFWVDFTLRDMKLISD